MSDKMANKTKNTIATTMRFDIRDMATILLFFERKGIIHKSLASTLRQTVTTFCDILKKHDPECAVEGFEEALKVLNRMGFGIEKVLHGNLADELRKEQIDEVLHESQNDIGAELRKALERKESGKSHEE